MVIKNLLKLACAMLLGWPLAVLAQSQDQLIDRYTTFAGSKQNATSLVTGLHNGTQVTLTQGTTKETFTLDQKMGYGSIDNALALAEAQLGKEAATPSELEAALMGGTAGGKTYEGILKMRYEDNMGWGLIAQKLGFKLGELKRADKATSAVTTRTERTARVERASRPDRPERPDRPDRPAKPR